MKTILISALILTLTYSCSTKDNGNNSKDSGEVTNYDFTKDQFDNRAQELTYIREYLNTKLPEILIKKFPEKMEKIQLQLITQGQDVTLEEAAKRSIHFSNQYSMLMSRFNNDNTSFKDAKWCLDNYDEYEKQRNIKNEQEEIKDIIPALKRTVLREIKDARKNSYLKPNSSDDYLTVADYYKNYFPKCEIIYEKNKTDNVNIYRISVIAKNNGDHLSETFFECNLLEKTYKHISTREGEELYNGE